MTTGDPNQPDIRPEVRLVAERLQRVEEAAMLSDHEREQLSEHVLSLTRALERLTARLDSLERRLADLQRDDDVPGIGAHDEPAPPRNR